MKTKILIFSFFLLLGSGISFIPLQASAQGGPVSFQVFYDNLSPYGTWVLSPDYGYVWVPNVAPGFTPYSTNGYWVFTNEGWTWVSDYSWGWAPFHYGRWYNDPGYGYMWVPDNEWGPGWVTWRRSEGYYGWAPIGPGVSINIAYSNSYELPYNQWTFVHDRDFGRRDIHNYYMRPSNNVTIIHNSTVINNTYIDKTHNRTYNAGPDRKDVEKRAGKTFTPVAIKESSKPGQKVSNNQLQIYRPQVQKDVSAGHKPAPSKVENINNLKPVNKQAVPPQHQPTPPQHNPEPAKQPPQKPTQQSLPVKQQPQGQPAKQQPPQQQPQHNPQPAKQQPPQQQPPHNPQPAKQQPPQQQPQHNPQPAKQQPPQQQPQHNPQPAKQQPPQQQPQHNPQPAKQQPPQQQPQHNPQPAKQQPPQQQPQHNPQPAPQQQQHNPQPAKQQPQQQPKTNPPQNPGEDKNPHK